MGATWTEMEADRAFTRATRARRRSSLASRLRRGRRSCSCLAVYEEATARRGGGNAGHGVREIALAAIRGTVEPNRAREFDCGFRPAGLTRARWQRVWVAEERGTVLPPISVVQIGDEYAVRDGHHRVSVARARGATTIAASIAAA